MLECLVYWRTLVPNGPRHNLDVRIKFGRRAENMLFEFVNTLPKEEAFLHFKKRWERYGLEWPGNFGNFRFAQDTARRLWEGKKAGIEGIQVALSLGLAISSREDEQTFAPPIYVDWDAASLFVSPRNLQDLVWLTLLQNSKRLGVCENYSNGGQCDSPFFLKYRPAARFCSQPCALTAQQESKRKWWNEHGQEWLAKRRAQKTHRHKRS